MHSHKVQQFGHPLAEVVARHRARTAPRSGTGSYVGSLGEMPELIQIARSGALQALPVATRPLDAVNDALSDLKHGRARGRVVLRS